MLLLFVTSVLVFGSAMSAMALGVVLRGRPLHHGCGEATTSCEACTRPCEERANREEATWNER